MAHRAIGAAATALVAALVMAAPASAQAPVACTGPQVELFNNWNTAAVTGGGRRPQFDTGGRAWCVIWIANYHWNGGQGQRPGTIGLGVVRGLGGAGNVLGPWRAEGSGANNQADWVANLPQAQPTVINGTYTCRDSHPRTWSQNTASGGRGFCKVIVQEAQNAPEPVQPQFAQSAGAEPVSGTVLVQRPGGGFEPLTAGDEIPMGSIVDARGGRVRIVTRDARGREQSSEFFEGVFRVTQPRALRGLTELQLFGGDFNACPKGRGARSAATRRSTIRRLWGEGSGKFRTRGRFATATLRGTTWLTADRCDGTLVRVTRGSVTVRDIPRRRNVVLKAPRRYLARGR